MKKLILLACLFSFSLAAFRLQAQAGALGYGAGLGLGAQVIPLLLEVGVEGSTHTLPTITNKGTHQGARYDGELNISSTRAGAYAKFTVPGLNLIPIAGIFAYPTLHVGTQSGLVAVDGSVRVLDSGAPLADKASLQGNYALLGFPNYFFWFFVEPSIGIQHIYVPGALNIDTVDAQIALGVSF